MDLSEYIDNLKRKIIADKSEILFVCIGTNEVLWDCIGPLIGSYLKKNISKEFVLGDIENNIVSKYDLMFYYPKLKNKFIIAIDAAVSPKELCGEIFISNNPIVMGLGLNRNKGVIGDLSIKIAISDEKNINIEYINNLAKFVVKGIESIMLTRFLI